MREKESAPTLISKRANVWKDDDSLPLWEDAHGGLVSVFSAFFLILFLLEVI